MNSLNEERPIFLQIADTIKDGIISGAYPEESQVPSITEFSVTYKINPATALKGVNLLVDEGLLYKKRGVGMFVSSNATKQLLTQRKELFYEKLIAPMLEEAKRLQISSDELIEMIERSENHGN